MKLNIGEGGKPIPGYTGIDVKDGGSAYPLAFNDGTTVPDASCEEVRASHILEHFPHSDKFDIVREWVRVLAPGGTLKIAVPDFAAIAQHYIQGHELPTEGYVMGGQIDGTDFHKSLFDEHLLSSLLRGSGLVSVRRWKSELEDDAAALPISLNLSASKAKPMPKIMAVISVPRLGFNDFWACAFNILGELAIPLKKVTGAYWERTLWMGMEEALKEDPDIEWILTMDYDSIFTANHLRDMIDIATRYPHVDALAPLQIARWHDSPMFTCADPAGKLIREVPRESIAHGEIIKAVTAHFGLTLIRVSALKKTSKPWFKRVFGPNNELSHDEAMDPDVYFWHHWRDVGNTLYVALRVPIGHEELLVRWPNINLEATHQTASNFWKTGPPQNIWR